MSRPAKLYAMRLLTESTLPGSCSDVDSSSSDEESGEVEDVEASENVPPAEDDADQSNSNLHEARWRRHLRPICVSVPDDKFPTSE